MRQLVRGWLTQAKRDLAELPPGTRVFVLGVIAADVVLGVVLVLML